MTNLYIDIETIPVQDERDIEYLQENVKPAGNLRDPEKIQQDIDRKAAAVVSESGLSGDFGEVWCICWAIDDGPVQSLSRDSLDLQYGEGLLLAEWIDQLYAGLCAVRKDKAFFRPTWIGHNVAGFDIPFLWKRCKVRNMQFPEKYFIPHNQPAWSEWIGDTMTEWEGLRGRISLDRLARVLKLPTSKTDGMDGSKVWDAVQEGRWKEVLEYCKRDVELVRQAWNRMQ